MSFPVSMMLPEQLPDTRNRMNPKLSCQLSQLDRRRAKLWKSSRDRAVAD
jgi:hypothetical protein